jgi:hypothetical protein
VQDPRGWLVDQAMAITRSDIANQVLGTPDVPAEQIDFDYAIDTLSPTAAGFPIPV